MPCPRVQWSSLVHCCVSFHKAVEEWLQLWAFCGAAWAVEALKEHRQLLENDGETTTLLGQGDVLAGSSAPTVAQAVQAVSTSSSTVTLPSALFAFAFLALLCVVCCLVTLVYVWTMVIKMFFFPQSSHFNLWL